MATTIEPEGDPTFLAYERARQFGENTLNQQAEKDRARSTQDVQTEGMKLAYNQADAVDQNMQTYRASGFGQSGIRAQAEDRIRRDIALQVNDLLNGYQRNQQDTTDTLTNSLAQMAIEKQTQEQAARQRLLTDNATAGVGL